MTRPIAPAKPATQADIQDLPWAETPRYRLPDTDDTLAQLDAGILALQQAMTTAAVTHGCGTVHTLRESLEKLYTLRAELVS